MRISGLWSRHRCIERERESTAGSPATASLKVLYTVIRADLPKGTQVAQVAHAASEACGYPPTIVVALQVADERELRELAASLAARDLAHALVVEDAGPFAGQAMALGIKPVVDRAAIRKVTSALALAK